MELRCREIERGVCICLNQNFPTLASEEKGLSYRRRGPRLLLEAWSKGAKLLKEAKPKGLSFSKKLRAKGLTSLRSQNKRVKMEQMPPSWHSWIALSETKTEKAGRPVQVVGRPLPLVGQPGVKRFKLKRWSTYPYWWAPR